MPGVRLRADRLGGGVHPAEVRPALGVDEQRDHQHDGVGLRHRGRGVRGRGQPPGGDELGELAARCASPGKGSAPSLTRSTTRSETSTPIDLVPLAGELDGERQADLAQGDDGDLHGTTFLHWAAGGEAGLPVDAA